MNRERKPNRQEVENHTGINNGTSWTKVGTNNCDEIYSDMCDTAEKTVEEGVNDFNELENDVRGKLKTFTFGSKKREATQKRAYGVVDPSAPIECKVSDDNNNKRESTQVQMCVEKEFKGFFVENIKKPTSKNTVVHKKKPHRTQCIPKNVRVSLRNAYFKNEMTVCFSGKLSSICNEICPEFEKTVSLESDINYFLESIASKCDESVESLRKRIQIVIKTAVVNSTLNTAPVDLYVDCSLFSPTYNYDGYMCSIPVFRSDDLLERKQELNKHMSDDWEKIEKKLDYLLELTDDNCRSNTGQRPKKKEDGSGMSTVSVVKSSHPIFKMMNAPNGMFFSAEAVKKFITSDKISEFDVSESGYDRLCSEAYAHKPTVPMCKSLDFSLRAFGEKKDVKEAIYNGNSSCTDRNGDKSKKEIEWLMNQPFTVKLNLSITMKFYV